ncbi:hypothetical protein HZ326_22722 [Fusarium oxysporum f. sp. albedinis]|nr:hypothetical protein HZ326_22722 [Fusarium oxysporum f. sp. albedinis]
MFRGRLEHGSSLSCLKSCLAAVIRSSDRAILRLSTQVSVFSLTTCLVTNHLSITASIIPDYQATSVSKKVNFCTYIDPNHDEADTISETVHALRSFLPLGMFNHTNHAFLNNRPIAISIKTKKTGKG